MIGLIVSRKGDKQRVVPINRAAVTSIESYRQALPADFKRLQLVFLDPSGGKMSREDTGSL